MQQCVVLMTLLKATSSILKTVAASTYTLLVIFGNFELASAKALPEKILIAKTLVFVTNYINVVIDRYCYCLKCG